METSDHYYFSADCRAPLPTDGPEYIVYAPTGNITCTNPGGCSYEEDYVYEYEASDSFIIPLDEVIPSGIIYGITFMVGVIGNALVIFSIARFRRMQNVTNIFLTSLASADLLLILICVPIKVRNPLFIIDYSLFIRYSSFTHYSLFTHYSFLFYYSLHQFIYSFFNCTFLYSMITRH
jgi:hypothetical protein